MNLMTVTWPVLSALNLQVVLLPGSEAEKEAAGRYPMKPTFGGPGGSVPQKGKVAIGE